jgi:four helix bundle protein
MNTTTENKIREFTDIKAWQEGHRLVVDIYRLSKSFPREAIFGLTSQMQRAAVSITSNIAEGFGRHGYREKVQFYYMAHGSLTEIKNQIFIARDIGYLTNDDAGPLISQLVRTHCLLRGLISKTQELLRNENS